MVTTGMSLVFQVKAKMPTSCTWKVPFKGKFSAYCEGGVQRIVAPFSIQARCLFSSGEADNRSGGAKCSFFIQVQKKVKTAKINTVAYVVWAFNFKSDFIFDLQGCLEATMASKPHF